MVLHGYLRTAYDGCTMISEITRKSINVMGSDECLFEIDHDREEHLIT